MNPHDGTDAALCPFKLGQRVRIAKITTAHLREHLGQAGYVAQEPHHLSHGWYVWVRLIDSSQWLFLADHLTAMPET